MCGTRILLVVTKLTSSLSQYVHSLWLRLHHFDCGHEGEGKWCMNEPPEGTPKLDCWCWRPDVIFVQYLRLAGPLIFIIIKRTHIIVFHILPMLLHCRCRLFWKREFINSIPLLSPSLLLLQVDCLTEVSLNIVVLLFSHHSPNQRRSESKHVDTHTAFSYYCRVFCTGFHLSGYTQTAPPYWIGIRRKQGYCQEGFHIHLFFHIHLCFVA